MLSSRHFQYILLVTEGWELYDKPVNKLVL